LTFIEIQIIVIIAIKTYALKIIYEKRRNKMSPKTTSVVTYIPVIGFILALAIGDKTYDETKFNINQSIVLSFIMLASGLCGIILGIIPFLGFLMRFLFGLVGLGMFVLAVIAAVFAATEQRFEIPVVSQIKIIN